MSTIDVKLKVRGKDYYASLSDTSDKFYSPIFESVEDYLDWYSNFNLTREDLTLDETDAWIYKDDQFKNAKKAVEILLAGDIPTLKMRSDLKLIYELYFKLKDPDFDFDKVRAKFEKLNLPIHNYSSIFDLLYFFFSWSNRLQEKKDKSLLSRKNVLKFIGWYLDKCFREVDYWKAPNFKTLYEDVVNFSKTKPKPTSSSHKKQTDLWQDFRWKVLSQTNIHEVVKTINQDFAKLNAKQSSEIRSRLLKLLRENNHIIKVSSKNNKAFEKGVIGSQQWYVSYELPKKQNWIIEKPIKIPDTKEISKVKIYYDIKALRRDLNKVGVSDFAADAILDNREIKIKKPEEQVKSIGDILLEQIKTMPSEVTQYLKNQDKDSLRSSLSNEQLKLFEKLHSTTLLERVKKD